jgi:hypothetical protein
MEEYNRLYSLQLQKHELLNHSNHKSDQKASSDKILSMEISLRTFQILVLRR